MTDEVIQREDTMIYRTPADDSDPQAVSNIWGKDLETRVVDAGEVDAMIGEGWVRDPRHIDNPPKAPVGSVPDKPDPRIAELEDQVAKLTDDLKAATDLADAESKAKDEALARVKELEPKPMPDQLQSAKPTLGIKGGKPTP
jgi:hypothetical protein